MHVTDPHLFADADSSLRGTVTSQSLQQVLDHIKTQEWPADIVAVTGDLIQDDTAGAYQQFCDQFASMGLPVYCVPGNHDVRELMQEALQVPGFHYCESVTIGDWLITAVDSCLSNSAGGLIDGDEMQRLATILDAATEKHILICMHHPPLPVGSKWLDGVGLANGREFLDLVSECGRVRGAIFGHVHQTFDENHGGIRIIGTPSTCRQFKVGSDDFAVDDNPPAYRRVSLLVDGGIDEELIWLSQ